jgi:hypothetical protein
VTTTAPVNPYFDELKWLQDNPDFDQRPASILEFLGDRYLNIEDRMREAVRDELVILFGSQVSGDRMAVIQEAIFTGAIGIGKTTIASIVLPYMAHWCLCLRDPQGFFDLLPGSRIAFMMMSTSESQAKEVLFGDIDARIKYSPWFRENYEKDPAFKNQIRFMEKDIWILPGDSAETTFEGYNILGGIIDEIDSHKVTKDKDYADVGFDTISGRIRSRFGDRGFLLLIGQMKKANGFAARKYDDFMTKQGARASRLTIWESFGWGRYLKSDGTHDSFHYDVQRKMIVPSLAVPMIENSQIMEIPNVYRRDFENNPEKSLRDLAGIPPATGDPFISLTYRISECVDRWRERAGDYSSPVKSEPVTRMVFEPWFKAEESLKRALHIDLAYSADGDGCGIAMGHVLQLVERDGESKPYIVFDMIGRIHAAPGTEIMISDVRNILYHLRDDLKFRIKMVTMDGFQSTDTMQQLRKRRFPVDYLSIDKSMLPYYDLREAIYEERVEFPPYFTKMSKGSFDLVEIAVKELSELEDDGKKVDHPERGSKDVADAMAGVVYTLMGDPSFRRKTSQMGVGGQNPIGGMQQEHLTTGIGGGSFGHPALGSLTGLSAPLPPSSLNPFRGSGR